MRLGFRWWRFVAALGLLVLAVSVWVALPPGRVDAQTAGSYHAAPFLFDTSDYLMVDNVGSLSPGSYHGPPYQFDTSDYLMVDCAVGCSNTSGPATFTNFLSDTYVPTTGCATGAPTAPVCIGSPTSTIGLAVGKVSGGWGGTTASNGGEVASCGNTGASDRCGGFWEDSSGRLILSSNGSGQILLSNSGSLNLSSQGLTGVSKITQSAVNDIWGSCAMSASTSCTITWTYAPTFCSKPNPVGTTVISGVANISSTTITVTAASSNSLTWDVTCQ